MKQQKMPFSSHLEELRKRLIICFIAVGIGFVISYFFSREIFELLSRPLLKVMPQGEKMVFTALPEAFLTYLKIALVSGIILASPMIFYQLWMFITPGLYETEKRYVLPFVVFSTLFFVGGTLFGYLVVFPFGFKFFMGFASDYIRPLPSIREYLSLSLKLLMAFGIVFQLPLLILFLSRLGIVDAKMLRSKQKYAILLIFIAAAVLTPPDVASQLMMAGPLMVLYEIGIWVAKVFGKKKEGLVEESVQGKAVS
ncbi:MAG TPA: twin-arginine translocase subunit TatC [Syntrophaceae bacterium]|nr:twin-arginine translocase subunit TatC [Syntrophaceae bacterium]